MSSRLIILGFLRGRALYGYELKQNIEHVMGDWTNIAFGSIYYALDKLADEGFVQKAGTEQEGNRPSRTVYEITEAGRAEFQRLLYQAWDAIERQYFAFDIALSFLDALKSDEAKNLLHKRVQQLEQTLVYLGEHQAEKVEDEHAPVRLIAAVFEHSRVHLAAELEWTRGLLKQVEQGKFDAEVKWMRNLMKHIGQERS